MKSLIPIISLLAAIAFAPNAFSATKEVSIGVNEAFIPSGLSTDTDAYAVVSGVFSNGCYSWSRATVSRHADEPNTLEVRSFANVNEGMCIMVLVPYSKEVRLGKLPQGENNIRFLNGDGTYMQKTIYVE